jgi:hypothetical protein
MLNRSYWPYAGYHLACAVVGWFIGDGVIGAALGFFLGPVGNLLSIAMGHK